MSEKAEDKEPIGVFLGEIRCECGGVAKVKRTKRRGNHYQSNCEECGIDQRAGKVQQARMAAYKPLGSLQPAKPVEQKETENKPVPPVETEPVKQDAKPRSYGLLAAVGVALVAVVGLSS